MRDSVTEGGLARPQKHLPLMAGVRIGHIGYCFVSL